MECQVYTLNRVYWDLHNKSNRLGHQRKGEKPKEVRNSVWDYVSILFDGEIWAVMWAIFFVSGCISFFVVMVAEDRYPPSTGKTISFPILLCVIVFVYHLWDCVRGMRRDEEKYQEDLVEYEAAVAADALRVQKELQVKAVLCAQRDAVLAEYWAARNALDALYSLDIIEGEYRDFAAVTTFYSYFRKEYCDRLAGPNQAYDRYDQALKFGEIINKLDVIINKLDEIIKNQAYLAELLRDSNNTLHRIEQGNEKMLQSMEAVEENSNLTEYNTRCAAESSKATALLTLFNTLKQNKDE